MKKSRKLVKDSESIWLRVSVIAIANELDVADVVVVVVDMAVVVVVAEVVFVAISD